jgi:DNA (cytosine-5)-methyltransferase 1
LFMKSAELFAGCGGMALGISRAGFTHKCMVEYDQDAVTTVLHNKNRGVEHVSEWPMNLLDVRDIDWKSMRGLDLVSGGPPCQPFGIGGKKMGHRDQRDMWPEAVRAIREARPRFFLFENVRNLAGPRFRSYLNWIVSHLEQPLLTRRDNETFSQHLARLNTSKVDREYSVVFQVVNAADYGAPQTRFRVLIFGVRSDVGITPRTMVPTHSLDRLLWDQFVTGEYWERHDMKRIRRATSLRDCNRLKVLTEHGQVPSGKPWLTVRDAIRGLGEPNGRSNHVLQLGAKIYPGHTGSPLDLPAKALKAGDHGVPGGENMMVRDDGTVRYFTTREAARLVGLPDDFEFPRSWSESMRQLGNAVPAQLATAAGNWVRAMATN